MAETSALYVVERKGPSTLEDVQRGSGLCETRAKAALEDLVRAGKLIHQKEYYFLR